MRRRRFTDRFLEEITLPKETVSDLEFPAEYVSEGLKAEITWITDSPESIDDKGRVNQGFTDVAVSISFEIRIRGRNETAFRNVGSVTVKKCSDEKIEEILKKTLMIPEIAEEYLVFPGSVEIFGKTVTLIWSSTNPEAISANGTVIFKEYEQGSEISVTAAVNERTVQVTIGTITVPAKIPEDHIRTVMSKVEIPAATDKSLTLPTLIDGVSITWKSSNTAAISHQGKWYFLNEDTPCELTATFSYADKVLEKKYAFTVLTITHEKRMEIALGDISIPDIAFSDLNLPTSFRYNVTGTWTSDHEAISGKGAVTRTAAEQEVTLTLLLHSGEYTMNKTYSVKTASVNNTETTFSGHMLVDYVNNISLEKIHHLTVENDRIVLNPSETVGYYESSIYNTRDFDRLIGSWSAITNTSATCELQVRVRVNGVWSTYLSYSKWGLGLHNALYDQDGGTARISDDEILINNGQKANAFQYRIVLERTSAEGSSPKLSLVGISLNITGYTFPVETGNLPKTVDYDVPKLYQHDVPTIGGSICSITSSTMLLLYKGHTFSDSLPHRENATLFFDYGHKIYGNWVYNAAGMGAYGENSYVKRIYSWEELQQHLATVGPVALSIRGNTGLYTTSGHLIVVRGYRITDSGTVILCNDPNVRGVYVEYPLDIIKTVSRNVIYVIE